MEEKYECPSCGNKRWFYVDVSIQARKVYDMKKGKDDGKIYNIEKDVIDNEFEILYCKKCGTVVDE